MQADDLDLVQLREDATDFDDWIARVTEQLPALEGPFAQLIRLSLDTAWALGAETVLAKLRDDPNEA